VPEERAQGDPQRNLLNRQLGERIRAVLEGLTAKERLVFELRHYQGLRLRAIGELLGSSEEAAKTCLFRATRKMRVALGTLYELRVGDQGYCRCFCTAS